jgi:thymidylate synthase
MRSSINLHASGREQFDLMYQDLCARWLKEEPFDRGEVHAQKITTPEMVTRELRDVILDINVPDEGAPGVTGQEQWAYNVTPNLPWAEDHFQERVSGEPLNPPPSEQYWPFAQAGNAAHKKDAKFSHTYPERFWPRRAGEEEDQGWDIDSSTGRSHFGIRYRYGDLRDLVNLMLKNPRTRQAYLPVWFPEDLAASINGERVPCTLGYHFMLYPEGKVHMTYYMRSCDLIRFFRDDVYMAGRLLQWVVGELHFGGHRTVGVGGVRMVIANLHAFEGDLEFIKQHAKPLDKRAGYNFGAMG